ncbi:MAG TPA: PEP-CTERM sorting domain-containing protein [Tepidisphaeraceae bacterium]|jgi:hypothetical protein|nr:PEP-CTERM sorting domain-containing protein [Tepidisphaeraceae bacterium]
MIRSRLLAALGIVFINGAVSYGAVSYSYVTDSPTYSANAAGQSLTVKVYLDETLTAGSTSLLTEGSPNGLVGAGFYAVETGGSGAAISAITANANSSTATTDPGFNVAGSAPTVSSSVAGDGSAARLLESDNSFPGPTGLPTAFGRQVFLGTLNILSGPSGSTTTYTLKTYVNAPTSLGGSAQDSNTVTYEFNDLDVTNNGGSPPPAYTGADSGPFQTFAVTTTPEPSSLMLGGLAVGGLLIRRRKAR